MIVVRLVLVVILAVLAGLTALALMARTPPRDQAVDILRNNSTESGQALTSGGAVTADLSWAYSAAADHDGDYEVFDAVAAHVETEGSAVSVEAIDTFYQLSLDDRAERDRFLDSAVELVADPDLDTSVSLETLVLLRDLWPESEPVYVLLLADDDPIIRQRALDHLPPPADGIALAPGSNVTVELISVASDPAELPKLRSLALQRLVDHQLDGAAREAADIVCEQDAEGPPDRADEGWDRLVAVAEAVLAET